jgi:general stress protein 26
MFRRDTAPVPWARAEQVFRDTRNYWLVTVRPDTRPHAMPVWGIWFEGAFYFSTGSRSRKARNLAVNSHCVVTTDQATEAVIIEGEASEVRDRSLIERFLPPYEAKYDWKMSADEGPYFCVRPAVAFAFTEGAEAGGATNPARWTFESP